MKCCTVQVIYRHRLALQLLDRRDARAYRDAVAPFDLSAPARSGYRPRPTMCWSTVVAAAFSAPAATPPNAAGR
jgi:hypothetical protein